MLIDSQRGGEKFSRNGRGARGDDEVKGMKEGEKIRQRFLKTGGESVWEGVATF